MVQCLELLRTADHRWVTLRDPEPLALCHTPHVGGGEHPHGDGRIGGIAGAGVAGTLRGTSSVCE